MDRVTPQLVLGSREDAQDIDLLNAFEIDVLLSLEPVTPAKTIRSQMQLSIKDRQPLPAKSIARALDFLYHQVGQGRQVLVHCQMGISRSPAIVAAYLHQYHGMPLDEAVSYIKHVRPLAEPHPALLDSLEAYFSIIRQRAS